MTSEFILALSGYWQIEPICLPSHPLTDCVHLCVCMCVCLHAHFNFHMILNRLKEFQEWFKGLY